MSQAQTAWLSFEGAMDQVISSALRDVMPRAGFEAGLLVLLAASPRVHVVAQQRHPWVVVGSVAGVIGAGVTCWGIVRRNRRRAA